MALYPGSHTHHSNWRHNMRKVIFLLDETGSMTGRKAETLSGYKEFLKTQRKENPDTPFTLVLFNSYQMRTVVENVPMKSVKKLTEKTYKPSHMTPLWDAIGKVLEEHTSDSEGGLVVICTDGEENCSQHYSKTKIMEDIEAKKNNGWKFLYIGVDLADASGGLEIGISDSYNTTDDMKRNFENLATTVKLYSTTGKVQYNN